MRTILDALHWMHGSPKLKVESQYKVTVFKPRTTDMTVSVADKPEKAPEFNRTYTCQITSEVSIKIELGAQYGRVFSYGILRQSDGRSVIFNIDRITDRVLDPALVPLVQRVVDQVLEMDQQFRKSVPTKFTDEQGFQWQRVN